MTYPMVLTRPLIKTAKRGVTASLDKPMSTPCMVICPMKAGRERALIRVYATAGPTASEEALLVVADISTERQFPSLPVSLLPRLHQRHMLLLQEADVLKDQLRTFLRDT